MGAPDFYLAFTPAPARLAYNGGMSTIPATLPVVPAAYSAPVWLPGRSAGLEFAALLAAPAASAPAAGVGLEALSSLQTGAGGGLEALLSYTVLRLIERLLNDLSPASEPSAASPERGWPVVGVLSQGYHANHHGLDIAVPIGTPVHSTQAGRVVQAGWNDQGYGNLVIVENGPYRTYYAHLDQIGVQVGDQLRSGAVVGLSGSTGNSTGPHVHYEVRRDGVTVDPSEADVP